MKVASGTTLQVVEVYVMNLRRAALAVLLAPAMVLAAAEGTPAEQPNSAGTAPVAQAAGTSATAEGDKKDEKKDEKKDGAAAAPEVAKQGEPKKNKLASAVQARTPEEQAKQSGVQVMVALDHWLGMGTLVDARHYSYLAANLTISPRYLFGFMGKRIVLSGSFSGTYEYSMPDTETGRRFSPNDWRVAVAVPVLFKEKVTGIAVTPSLSLAIPMRPESWQAGLITNILASAQATRTFGDWNFFLRASASYGLFTSAVSSVRPGNPNARDPQGNLLVLCRVGEVACGGGSPNTLFNASLGGTVMWRARGDLMFYTGYTYAKSWRYAVTYEQDEFTAKAYDSNGNPVARVGLGQMDNVSTFLGGSYQLNDHFSLDLGISTGMPPLTATGLVRFPFFGVGNAADNVTTGYFTVTAAY